MTEGAIQVTTLKEGTGESPPDTSNVIVHVKVFGEDGKLIDDSRSKDHPLRFRLGERRVAECWEVALRVMKRGEIARVETKPGFGSGSINLFELELVDWIEWQDVSESQNRSVLKKILKSGRHVGEVNLGARVTVLLDSERAEWVIGSPDYDHSWELELGVMSMRKEEHALLRFSDKEVSVELVDVAKAPDPWEVDAIEEKVKLSSEARSLGNTFFQREKWEHAARQYLRAASYVKILYDPKNPDAVHNAAVKARLPAFANAAACMIKLERWKEAESFASAALAVDQRHLKSLYRKALAQFKQKDASGARATVQTALSIDSHNSSLLLLKKDIAEAQRLEDARDGQVMRASFS